MVLHCCSSNFLLLSLLCNSLYITERVKHFKVFLIRGLVTLSVTLSPLFQTANTQVPIPSFHSCFQTHWPLSNLAVSHCGNTCGQGLPSALFSAIKHPSTRAQTCLAEGHSRANRRRHGSYCTATGWTAPLLVAVRCLSQGPTLLQRHGLWPARFLCPWDLPSKDTGEGCVAISFSRASSYPRNQTRIS